MAMSPRLLRPRAPGGYTFRALRQGLVAYWPMNETATSGDVLVGDETGRGNHLGSVNSVLSVAGRTGNGRQFAAANSEYLSAAANTDLQLGNNDWTLSFWINVASATNLSNYVAKDSSAAREFFILQLASGARPIRFALFNSAASEQTLDLGSITLSAWNWVAMRHTGGVVTCRVNGASGTITRAGGTTWVTQSTPWTVGRRDFTGFLGYTTGSVDEMAKWNRALSDAELDTLYNNGNGINLAAPRAPSIAFPTATNADAQAWINNVYANGGTVSTATANAVNTFCTSIESAGIRDRFYRLNLFAGTGLSAALVPLFRGQSLGGTQSGNVTDTNFNFVSGDYVEGAGLAGNGTNKHLRIGTLSSVYQGVPATGHMAVRTTGASGAGRRAMGVFDLVTQSGQPYSMYYGVYRGGQGQMEFGRGGISVRTPTSANALILINRSSTTSLEYYENSSQIGSATTNESINRDIPSAEISVFGQSYYNWTNATFSHGYEPPAATFSSYSCGLSMSGSQVAAYSGALNTFLTAMGRS